MGSAEADRNEREGDGVGCLKMCAVCERESRNGKTFVITFI